MIRAIKNRGIKWWVGASSCFLLILIIGVFGYIKMGFVLKGVKIEATLTQNKSSSLVQINGNAKNSIKISLNGREIFIDKKGNFSETVGLLPGLSIISLNAEDQFGKFAEKKFEIIYEGSHESIVMLGSSN